MADKALTVAQLKELLKKFRPGQRLVFSDVRFGDFDLVGDTGSSLSPDNFTRDIRPILRLEKR